MRKGSKSIAVPKKKANKYHNHKCEYEGIKFDSIKERDRYIFLLNSQEKGLISDLQRQVKFELIPSITEDIIVHLKTKDKVKKKVVQLAINYHCDFQYKKGEEIVVEDVKASQKRTALDKVFLLKEKIFFWKFGKRIRKVYEPNEPI